MSDYITPIYDQINIDSTVIREGKSFEDIKLNNHYVLVFSKELLKQREEFYSENDARTLDYSRSIGTADVVRCYDGSSSLKMVYKRKVYAIDYHVCGYTPQACIYV